MRVDHGKITVKEEIRMNLTSYGKLAKVGKLKFCNSGKFIADRRIVNFYDIKMSELFNVPLRLYIDTRRNRLTIIAGLNI